MAHMAVAPTVWGASRRSPSAPERWSGPNGLCYKGARPPRQPDTVPDGTRPPGGCEGEVRARGRRLMSKASSTQWAPLLPPPAAQMHPDP